MENATPDPPAPASSTLTILSAKEAAELLGVHFSTVYEAAGRGEIPCRRVGRRFIFCRETLLRWLVQDTTADRCESD